MQGIFVQGGVKEKIFTQGGANNTMVTQGGPNHSAGYFLYRKAPRRICSHRVAPRILCYTGWRLTAVKGGASEETFTQGGAKDYIFTQDGA